MKPLLIEKTNKTPHVMFDAKEGILEIKGRSIPEDAKEFYHPLINWVSQYSKLPNGSTTVNISLDYFNTSSSRWLFDLIKALEIAHKSAHEVTINWFYERDDEDMIEVGEAFESKICIPFNKIEVDSFD